MYISRKNSQILAVGILVAFFLFTSIYVSIASRSQEVVSLEEIEEIEEEPQQEPEAKSTSTPEAKAEQEEATERTFAMKDFHRSETKAGKMLWEIRGTEANFAPNSKAVTIQDCRLHYLSKDETPIILTSKEAILHLEGTTINRAEFLGDVVMVHDKKTKMKTEKAEYFRDKNRLIAPDDVEIIGELYTITGKRLEGDLEARSFEILYDVKSNIQPQSKKKKHA